MSIGYVILVAAAFVLIGMAIESLLKSTSLLNMATALLLSIMALVIGSLGMIDYFAFINNQTFAIMMLKVQNAGYFILGYSIYLFSLHFPRDKSTVQNRKMPYLLGILAALAVFSAFIGWDITNYLIIPKMQIMNPDYISSYLVTPDAVRKSFQIRIHYNFLHYLFIAVSSLLTLYSLISIIMKYKKVHLLYQKKQIRYFLFGIAIFIFFWICAESLIRFLPVEVYYFLLAFAFVLAGGFMLYAVISYRFFNLRNKMGSILQELLISMIVLLPIVLTLYVFRIWFASLNTFTFFLVLLPALIFCFWLFGLSKDLLKKVLNMHYGRKDLTEVFLDRIGPSHTIGELAKRSIDVLTEHINCRSADFLLFDREKEIFRVIHSASGRMYAISAIDPLFRHISIQVDVYDREMINFDPRFAGMKDIAERFFEEHETALIIPLFYENNLTALVFLSAKMDNNIYTTGELLLMAKLKKIIKMVMDNIILFNKDQDAKLTKRDLLLASNIQDSVFQKVIPTFEHIDVYAYQKSAKEVSGDYFMVEKAGPDSLGLLIADVSGKGFSAALISMVIHTIARSQEFYSTTTNAIVSRINEVMTTSQDYGKLTKTMSFATVCCCYLDNKQKTLYYTNAGHLPILIYQKDTKVFDSIKANSKPVGIFQEELFYTQTYPFVENSIFVLYSDGITEAINQQEEEFGFERLQNVIADNANQSARVIADTIINSVEDFAEGQEQFDDITLIVIKL